MKFRWLIFLLCLGVGIGLLFVPGAEPVGLILIVSAFIYAGVTVIMK